MNDKVHGTCLCGEVQFDALGPPDSVAACHCQSCRKHTGAPVAVFVDYKVNQVSFLGRPMASFESSHGVQRGFCSQCGSTLSYQARSLPSMIHIHIGAFDEPDRFTPTENENTSSQLPWVNIQIHPVD